MALHDPLRVLRPRRWERGAQGEHSSTVTQSFTLRERDPSDNCRNNWIIITIDLENTGIMRAYGRGTGLIWADRKLAERNCLLSGYLKEEDCGLKYFGKCFW